MIDKTGGRRTRSFQGLVAWTLALGALLGSADPALAETVRIFVGTPQSLEELEGLPETTPRVTVSFHPNGLISEARVEDGTVLLAVEMNDQPPAVPTLSRADGLAQVFLTAELNRGRVARYHESADMYKTRFLMAIMLVVSAVASFAGGVPEKVWDAIGYDIEWSESDQEQMAKYEGFVVRFLELYPLIPEEKRDYIHDGEIVLRLNDREGRELSYIRILADKDAPVDLDVSDLLQLRVQR